VGNKTFKSKREVNVLPGDKPTKSGVGKVLPLSILAGHHAVLGAVGGVQRC